VFSWQTTHPVGAKKHHKNTKPESRQTAKMYFFLSSSSSDGLVQICLTLSRWFSHTTAASPLSSAPAYRFIYGLKSYKGVKTAH